MDMQNSLDEMVKQAASIADISVRLGTLKPVPSPDDGGAPAPGLRLDVSAAMQGQQITLLTFISSQLLWIQQAMISERVGVPEQNGARKSKDADA